MINKDYRPYDAAGLRGQAEENALEKTTLLRENIEALTIEEMQEKLHELRVRQIELEMQNEELKRTQLEQEASRDRCFNVYDLLHVGYITLDEQGQIIDINLNAVNLLGVPRDSIVSQLLTCFILPEDQDIYRCHRKQLFDMCAPKACELRLLRPGNPPFWVCLDATVARDAKNGEPISIVVISDITDRKQEMSSLAESEQRHRALVNSGPALIWTSGLDKLCDYFNEPWLLFTGRTLEQELGSGWAEGVHPEDFNRCLRTYATAFDNREMFSMELRLRHASGEYRWILNDGVPRFDGKDKFLGYIGHCLDITERMRMQEVIRENEELYRLSFENVRDVIYRVDNELRIQSVSPGVKGLLGYKPEELVIKTFLELNIISPEYLPQAFSNTIRILSGEQISASIYEFIAKDGTRVFGEVSGSPLYQDGKVIGLVSVARDITERKLAEETLQRSEARLNRAELASKSGNWELNLDSQMITASDGAMKLYGVDKNQLEKAILKSIPLPEYRPLLDVALKNLIKENGLYDIEFKIKTVDTGEIKDIHSIALFDKEKRIVIGIIHDITERKRAEEKKAKLEALLQQAQKFEAIATLAGGIAHDFNNLLMGIQGRASLISWDLEISHPHREHIHVIEEYIRSATNLTQQLLGFARGGKYEVKPVDMNELVRSSSDLFGRTKKEIRIHIKCQSSPLVVEADQGQVEQVLLNMYVNAWQAMPPEGGELYLETKIIMMDEAHAKPHQIKPGRYAMVSITDTGAGMNEATRLRIFDPFFTTKEMGRGTGLGLASAYGIIKNHGGMITVYSEIGHGTTFNIYLPVSDKDVNREFPIKAKSIEGSETILLVDDEEMIIDVSQAILERLGYRVVVCRGGQDAVKIITDMGNEIDLVILDMIMPGMDGSTAFDCIREIQPGVPVLLSSGYAFNGQAHEIMRRGCNGFIQKPYNILELSQKIRKVFDEVKGLTQQ